jgi:hypothetical protein
MKWSGRTRTAPLLVIPVVCNQSALSLRRHEAALTAAASLTGDITFAAGVVDAVLAYVFGTVTQELTELQAQRRSGLTKEQWQASVAPYIRDVIKSGSYPQFAPGGRGGGAERGGGLRVRVELRPRRHRGPCAGLTPGAENAFTDGRADVFRVFPANKSGFE